MVLSFFRISAILFYDRRKEEKEKKGMKVINVAIIGQGRSGRYIHGQYLKTDPAHYRIAAVADPIPERRAMAAGEYRCAVYKDYREIFGQQHIDLIVNASPSHQHVPITLESLKAGFHVLCEKPLASRVKDADRLIAASKKHGRVLAIFQQARFAPYFLKVREVINSGVLGRIVQISVKFNGFSRRWDWQTLQNCNGGSLLNTGPHPLDQALTLFGEGKPDVRCFMDRANTYGNAEDHVKLILSGEGHPLIDIEISCCCAYPETTYNVYGACGGMKATQSNAEWKFFKLNEAPRRKLIKAPLRTPDGSPAYCGENLSWRGGKWPAEEKAGKTAGKTGYVPSSPGADMSAAFYAMLYKSLTANAPLEITPEQVRRQIAVIEECRRQNPRIYGKGRGRSQHK